MIKANGEYKHTTYETLINQVKKLKCPTCRGSGMCDDLEPGDIGGNEWVCETCHGIGLRKGAKLTLELS